MTKGVVEMTKRALEMTEGGHRDDKRALEMTKRGARDDKGRGALEMTKGKGAAD